MKTLVIFLILFVFVNDSNSQNVGIGTGVPVYKLQIHDAAAANTFLSLTNSGTGTSASDGLLIGLAGNSAIVNNLENGNLRLGTNNLTRIMIDASGNVGIGNLTPANKLDLTGDMNVNGAMKLEGLNLFEFGAGVAGKEVNAGKIGYNAFGQSALTFIGAGTNATNRAVFFYAEGGTTFSGPATVIGNTNLNGQLRIAGNPGAAGQVLTSNGAAQPAWKESAFGNNTRFSIKFTEVPGNSGTDATIWHTSYNLNPADVTINPSSITINKSGLYHFDISMLTFLGYSVVPTFSPRHELWFHYGSDPLDLVKPIYNQMNNSSTANTSWTANHAVSLELYITAPATLRFSYRLGASSGGTISNFDIEGFASGYLISE